MLKTGDKVQLTEHGLRLTIIQYLKLNRDTIGIVEQVSHLAIRVKVGKDIRWWHEACWEKVIEWDVSPLPSQFVELLRLEKEFLYGMLGVTSKMFKSALPDVPCYERALALLDD